MDDINDQDQISLNLAREFLFDIHKGDPAGGLMIAQMLLGEGPNFKPELLIELIEAVVELSALAGSSEAKEYLTETWPTLKDAHLRRLLNKVKKA